jgi:hypothetical protein
MLGLETVRSWMLVCKGHFNAKAATPPCVHCQTLHAQHNEQRA